MHVDVYEKEYYDYFRSLCPVVIWLLSANEQSFFEQQ